MIAGIDPGLKGAIAFLGEVAEVQSLPVLDGRINGNMLGKLLKGVDLVLIEKVGTRAGQGAQHTMTTGVNYGIIIGLLMVLEIPYREVVASKWKREMGVTCPPDATAKERKEKAIARTIELFPSVPIQGPKGGYLDGLAEALLIAEYGRRVMGK